MRLPPETHATVQPSERGLTLEQYAEAKKLPVDHLQGLGVEQFVGQDARPYLRMAYLDEGPADAPVFLCLPGQSKGATF